MADLGYRLRQRHRRKGLASEGARELLRYGFDDVGLHRIIAQALAVNTGSRAFMERIGLTYARTLAGHDREEKIVCGDLAERGFGS